MSDKLISLRFRSGLSAGIIADRLNITEANYARFETGELKPDLPMLARIAAAMGVSMEALID